MAQAPPRAAFTLHGLRACTSDAHYAGLVARTRALIGAGDLFQANVCRLWEASGHGDPRASCTAAATMGAACASGQASGEVGRAFVAGSSAAPSS